MENKPTALWDKCLLLIKENVSEQQFNAWFKPIAFESFHEAGRTLILQVPSNFFVEYLEENYVGLLTKVLTRYFGQGIRLNYRIMVDKTHKITQEVEPEPIADIDYTTRKTTRVNQTPTVLDAAKPQDIDSQLDPRHTFANYIEGDSNKLPRSVGLSIAEHPNSTQFNPMFIYGPSGCGKTHLINAIGVRAKELYPQKRVLYISARLFQVQYTDAVLKNCTNDFINFYQTIDMLIVDDIQEWVSATKTQETFFHIFNHLFRNGKRIILACDRPPVDLQGMSDRLLTRFSCGLIAELEKPNIQLCVDILNSKIKRDGLHIPEEVVQFIAQTANGSVRDLGGSHQLAAGLLRGVQLQDRHAPGRKSNQARRKDRQRTAHDGRHPRLRVQPLQRNHHGRDEPQPQTRLRSGAPGVDVSRPEIHQDAGL